MKAQLLDILRAGEDYVSGEHLSTCLGISRVAVWKHIQKLKACGYPIVSASKGYRLDSDPDTLFPWDFPERESRIHYHEEVTSTMDIARELARGGCPAFSVVIAGRQTRGRGRLQRKWKSSDGGLYFTLVVRPDLPAIHSAWVNFAASLEMARVLRADYGVEAGVKWPNDILVSGRKLAGMLSEMEVEGDLITFVSIGMGVNVNNNTRGIEPPAISLKEILGREVPRKTLLARFLDRFENRMDHQSLESVIQEWKPYAVTPGQTVKIVTTRDIIEGVAVDVEPDGALLVRTDTGEIRRVVYGDCFHTGPSA